MKILLINQTFYPDSVSTSQHLTDLAECFVSQGHSVTVIAGSHGYDDPSQRYPKFEEYHGIKIFRLSYTCLGKSSRWRRAVDFLSFNLSLLIKLIFVPSQDIVVGLTSPPLVAVFGNLFCRIKGGCFVYWVMDLNPDEAIAAGWLKERSLSARFLKSLSRWTFRHSRLIIALDRFMKKNIQDRYGANEEKITVMPPWAHDEHIHPVTHEKNPFRHEQELGDKFVVMYSGNHSPCHPLKTLLESSGYYDRFDQNVLFYFIGGGSRVKEVTEYKESWQLKNIVQMGYQPLNTLSFSLSAADVHVVVMGEPFVGIVHPCKLYGVLSTGRPFIFIGPKRSAIGDIIKESGLGIQVDHGNIDDLIKAIEMIRRLTAIEKENIQDKSITLKNQHFGHEYLCKKLAQTITGAYGA